MSAEIRCRNGVHEFEVEDGERILYAGLRNGLSLPYECATGTCGNCKARLLEGAVEELWPGAPGKQNLKTSRGDFLMCQCTADGPMVAEVPQPVSKMALDTCVPSRIDGTIQAPRKLTHDVIALNVRLNRPVSFDAGQFMVVEVPEVAGARGYSMVNYAAKTDELEFVIKSKPGGRVSKWLFGDDRQGALIRLFGPLGAATFHPDVNKNLLCIAGGTGIAGIMSILGRACEDDYFTDHEGDIFFGVRTPADAFYLNELSEFRERFPNSLNITVAFSDKPADDTFKRKYSAIHFSEGLVHDVAGKQMAGRLENIVTYLAGPPPAVDASIRLLIMSRVSAGNIKYDKFS